MREFVSEAVGVDFSLLRTIKDLIRTPSTVVESYLRHDRIYVSPFKALFTVAALWVLVMNLLLDWHAIGREYAAGLFEALTSAGIRTEGTSEEMVELTGTVGTVFHAIFARYFIVFILAIIPLQAAICTRLTKDLAVPFRTHLAVLAYQTTLKLFVGFALAVGFGLDVLVTFATVIALAVLTALGWRPALIITATVPTDRFFGQHQRAISSAYQKASIIILGASTVVGMLVGLIAALLNPSLRG